MNRRDDRVAPAWWQTPRRSALRAACWLVAFGWATAAAWRLTYSELDEIGGGVLVTCTPTLAAGWAQVGIAGAGIGLIWHALNVPPRSIVGRAVVIAAVGLVWLVTAFLWLPHAPHICAT